MARVFISYARADGSRAEEIREWLHADGHEVFLDLSAEDGLRVGKEWKPQLYAVLRDADAVVCVVSPAFLASTWCAAEIAVADARGCLVLPLRVASSGPHPVIESLHYADYEADPGGVRARVLAQLREIDGGGRASWGEGDNPYPGLAAFTEASASVFFGRGRETRALADQIRAAAAGGPAVLALGGPSGCGKSSLLAAGLVPHLRADRSWLVLAPFTPSNDPVTRLVLRLTEAGRVRGWDWPPQLVRSRLADLDGGLAELAADLLATTTGSEHRRLLIAVDQGEELFTQAESARVDQFFRLVRAAATGGGPVRTLVGLRSEFLDDLSTLPALAGTELSTFVLGPLDREMLALAIGQPARLAGLRLDPELTPALVADTGHGDALPLLAFTLNRLAEGRRRGDTITLADYHRIGGVNGALTAHADAALATATDTSGLDRAAVLGCLARLATVDDTGRRVRQYLDQDTLSSPQRQALAAFVTARLLTSHRDDDGTVRIGPAHEALLTEWEPLDTTLTDRSAALATVRSIERAAADWTTAGRTNSYLWDRDRLTSSLTTLADGHPDTNPTSHLTAQARAFLDATHAHVDALRQREQQEQRRARRRRTTSLASTAAILVLTLTAGLVLWQWRAASSARRDAEQARAIAASIGMITQADLARGADPRTAMELGVAAYRLNPSPETKADLIDTLINTRYTGALTVDTDNASFATRLSPDWRTLATGSLATGSEDGTITLWDLTDRAHPTRLGHLARALSAEFSPDSRTVVTTEWDDSDGDGTDDGFKVVLWDITDRAKPTTISQLSTHTDTPPLPPSVTFAPDGTTLATTLVTLDEDTSGKDGEVSTTVVLWDITDRAKPTTIGQLPTYTDTYSVSSVRFAPDRHTLATTLATPGGEGNDGKHSPDITTVVLWDITDPAKPTTIGHPIAVPNLQLESAEFAPDGRTLATIGGEDTDGNGSPDRTAVVLWDTAVRADPKPLGQPLATRPDAVLPVAFSRDGRTLATAGTVDGTVAIWDLTDRTHPTLLDHPPAGPHAEMPMAFSSDGRTIATVGGPYSSVALWDLTDHTPVGQHLLNTTISVWSVAFSPDGRTLAAGGYNNTVALWDIIDDTHPASFDQPLVGPAASMPEVAFSPDGLTLATAGGTDYLDQDDSGEFDGAVALWDLTDRTHPTALGQPLAGPIDWVKSVAFSPDGRTLAAGTDTDTVVLWDLTDRTHPTRLGQPLTGHTGDVEAVAFSPDGRTLATGSQDTTVMLWDLTDRTHPTTLGQPLTDTFGSVSSVAFSPDGRTLAANTPSRTMILWDLTDRTHPTRLGQPVIVNADPEVNVESVAFSPDGRILASGSSDGTVALWDVTDRTRPAHLGQPLTGHTYSVKAESFSPNGRTLATGSVIDGTVILWDLTALRDVQSDPFAAACARGGNGITPETWKVYAGDIPFQHPCG